MSTTAKVSIQSLTKYYGTNLVLTDQPVTKKTRSNPGFSVMAGPKEERALEESAK